MLKATNIEWDIDLNDNETYEEALEDCGLPCEVILPNNLKHDDDIEDWLSDTYGFCINSFCVATDNSLDTNGEYMSLYQIKQFIEKKEGKRKQIVFTKTAPCIYIDNGCPDMYLILDEDIQIQQVEMSDEYGLIINDNKDIPVNVLLWDEEVENGMVSVTGAMNGVLNIELWGCEIRITRKLCDEILSIPSIDMLNKVDTKFGTIYIESLNANREEPERIKIYDSDVKYIDYFSVEHLQSCADAQGITLEEEYAIRIQNFRTELDIGNLLFCISTSIVSWRSHKPEYTDEFVNHIGDFWTEMIE